MTTIPQIARAMREIFTTTADEAARATRFVPRTSPLGGATFSQTLVFGFLGNPEASLEELTQTTAALGGDISPPALDQHVTAPAADCLQEVLHAAIACVVTADPVAMPWLERFTAVFLQDSSTIVLPDVLAAVWQSCGGSSPAQTSAALKLQVRLEMRTGRLDVQLQDGRASDRAALLPGPLPAGALRLADLGYWGLGALQALGQQGVLWLSRLQTQTAVYDTTGCRRELLELLESSATAPLEQEVLHGWRWRRGPSWSPMSRATA